jgi:hypothetical protein
MDQNHHIWQVWAETLDRWGVRKVIASLLEVAGPSAVLVAQFVYLGQPLLQGFLPTSQLNLLASTLEDDQQRHDFINTLNQREI